MGAFAPAPIAYDAEVLTATFVQPVLDHLAANGTPYVGVLYAGLMLTADGPKLLEFNCRFGDPEAQALLPLVESDLVEVLVAACDGRLSDTEVVIRPGAACTVVAARPAIPNPPRPALPISLGRAGRRARLPRRHRARRDGRLVTAGGRVLAVTGVGADLGGRSRASRTVRSTTSTSTACRCAATSPGGPPAPSSRQYAAAGVDIDEGNLAVQLLKHSVERTHTPAVLGRGRQLRRGDRHHGAEGPSSARCSSRRPTASAPRSSWPPGPGAPRSRGRTSSTTASTTSSCRAPARCSSSTTSRPPHSTRRSSPSVVGGMAHACEAAGCVLLGGETAEMPGVYTEGPSTSPARSSGSSTTPTMLPRAGVAAGDVLVGLGVVRPAHQRLLAAAQAVPVDPPRRPTGRRSTVRWSTPSCSRTARTSGVLEPVLWHPDLKALAHITGGGLLENLPRVLPDGVGARVHLGSWPVPPLFRLVREVATGMSDEELHRTLNMGIGMVLVCDRHDVAGDPGRDRRADVGHRRARRRAEARRARRAVTARLVVLVSGNGSNLQAILDACERVVSMPRSSSVVSNNGRCPRPAAGRPQRGSAPWCARRTRARSASTYDERLARVVVRVQPRPGRARRLDAAAVDELPAALPGPRRQPAPGAPRRVPGHPRHRAGLRRRPGRWARDAHRRDGPPRPRRRRRRRSGDRRRPRYRSQPDDTLDVARTTASTPPSTRCSSTPSDTLTKEQADVPRP